MLLQRDARGRFWGATSGGRPVQTDDPDKTVIVNNIDLSDETANHVASLFDLVVIQNKIIAISVLGGNAGKQVCRSTHDDSPGCFRMVISVATSPLSENVFGVFRQQKVTLPANTVEYPRVMVDPAGNWFLMANFVSPPDVKFSTVAGRGLLPGGVQYIPFDPSSFLQAPSR
jgi:hypothetical protein